MQSKHRFLFVTMIQKHSKKLLNVLKTKQIIMGGIVFNCEFAEIVNLVKTSVKTIECFTFCRPFQPRRFVHQQRKCIYIKIPHRATLHQILLNEQTILTLRHRSPVVAPACLVFPFLTDLHIC